MTPPLSDELNPPAKVRLTVLAGTCEFVNLESGESGAGRRLALLAYLHLGPPVTTRDELCELLWDPEPGKDAQHRLRELISATRRDLPPGMLITEGRTIRIDRDVVESDVDDFRKAVAEGDLEAAAALYQSDFMSDCSPRGASYFRDWADELRRQLQREYVDLLEVLVDRSDQARDYERASHWAERLWEGNRNNERHARLLLDVLHRAGSRRDLLRYASAIESYFREMNGTLSRELQRSLAAARAAPKHDRKEELPPQIAEPLVPPDDIVRDPADSVQPPTRHRMLVPALAVGVLMLAIFVWVQSRSAASDIDGLFGGGGTLIVRQENGTTHAFRFVGPNALDTAAAQVELADSILLWGRQWSQTLRARADTCEPRGSDDRDACIRYLDGDSTRIVSAQPGEDIGLAWSPDGSWLLIKSDRGVVDNYNYDLYAVEIGSGRARRLSNDAFQSEGEWSPDGSRIAIVNISPRSDSIHVRTMEGATVVSRALGNIRAHVWSPDGREIAVTTHSAGATRLLLFAEDRNRELPVPLDEIERVAWSPNGSVLAIVGTRLGKKKLIVCALQTCEQPLLEIPAVIDATWLSDSPTPYLDAVELSADSLRIAAGENLQLLRKTFDHNGRAFNAPYLVTTVTPTSAGWIDAAYVFHAMQPGVATIVASAGGWRADTIVVRVTASQPRLLMSEDWERGLDTTRWKLYGHPLPEVVGKANDRAFRNNGDSKYPSGVVTRSVHDLSQGITLEWRQSTPLTGTFWQEIWVDLVNAPIDSFSTGRGEPYRSRGDDIAIRTPQQFYQPPVSKLWVVCGDSRGPESLYPNDFQDQRWRHFVFQIHANGQCELIVDGRVIVAPNLTRAPDLKVPRRLALGGRTHQTQILVDDVHLWRGIRWGISQDGRASPLLH